MREPEVGAGESATVRRAWLDGLVDTVRLIGASTTFAGALEELAGAVTRELGFAGCAVNVTRPSGDLRVDAVSGLVDGPAGLGQVRPRAWWDEILDGAEVRGVLRLHRREQHPDPDRWHEGDALLAPLFGRAGDLIGVLSADHPAHGRVPDREEGVGLELFASQAALVIAAANRADGLRDQARLYRAAFRGTSVPTLILDASLLIVDANQAAGRLFGAPVADLLDRPVGRVAYPLDAALLQARCREQLAAAASAPTAVAPTAVEPIAVEPIVVEHRVTGRRRSTTWVRTSIAPVASAVSGPRLVLNVEDVTEAKRTLAELHLLADLDPLTGLPNRHATYDLVADAVDRCGPDEAIVVLVASIDGWKGIVHDQGPRVADELVVQLATRLQVAVPLGVRLGRLVGDELVVVGPVRRAAADRVGALAHACLETARSPFDASSVRFSVTLSVGAAVSTDPDVEPASLVEAARVAGFEAYVGGGDRWHLGSPGDPRG